MVEGSGLVRVSWAGTIVFTAATILALIAEGLRVVAVGVSVILFAAGIASFLWAYGIAVGRSRTDSIGIGGLYFLAGDSAPPIVRRQLLGSLAAQTVVGIVAAAARPYTSLAFGVLVPMFGLGLSGLWGARHGTFGPRAGG